MLSIEYERFPNLKILDLLHNQLYEKNIVFVFFKIYVKLFDDLNMQKKNAIFGFRNDIKLFE